MISDLIKLISEKDRRIDHLEISLSEMIRQRFGRRSERLEDIAPKELLLFIAEYLKTLESVAKESQQAIGQEKPKSASKKKGHGWRKLPVNMEPERVIYDLEESEKTCTCCVEEMACIGEEVSEQLDYIPAKLYKIEHARKKKRLPALQRKYCRCK